MRDREVAHWFRRDWGFRIASVYSWWTAGHLALLFGDESRTNALEVLIATEILRTRLWAKKLEVVAAFFRVMRTPANPSPS